tara:strand:- start:739 stop:891 length:153 start_codon:yes stop_codon:yes gene_type:complete
MGAKSGYWDGHYDEDFWENVMSFTGCLDVEREKTTPEGVVSSLKQEEITS